MQTKWHRIILTLSLLALLLISAPLTAFAQGDVNVRITQVDNSKFPTVTVYVSVTDSAGNPVGIDPATIQISENGQVMQITDIKGGGPVGGGTGEAIPVTTMLVMDISGSMDKDGKLDSAKTASKAYISAMRPGDQAGLMAYDTQVYSVQPITGDTAALTSAIDSLQPGSDTAMYDALAEAEKALEGVTGRKAIVVLTDGLDNQSHVTAEDVIAGTGQSGLTISAVGFGDPSSTGQTGLDEAGLKSLAEKTGGIYALATDVQALTQFYQQYGEALQHEYALTYVSPSTLRDGVNRGLTVTIAAPSGQATGQTQYNPGGVLPEVPTKSWSLFGWILVGLLVLLIIPFAIARGTGMIGGARRRQERRQEAAIHQEKSKYITNIDRTPSRPSSNVGVPRPGKKPRIKIK